jgi:hypothetical protein
VILNLNEQDEDFDLSEKPHSPLQMQENIEFKALLLALDLSWGRRYDLLKLI